MKFTPKKVSKNAALNPVARAYAWKALVDQSTTYKIIIYSYEEGHECRADMVPLAQYFATILIACEIDAVSDIENLKLKQAINLALSIIKTLSYTLFKWQQVHAVVFDDALDASALLLKVLKPQSVRLAFLRTEE